MEYQDLQWNFYFKLIFHTSWNHVVTIFLKIRHEILILDKMKSCSKRLKINSAVFQFWKYGTAKVHFVAIILKCNYFCCIGIMMFEHLTQHNKIRYIIPKELRFRISFINHVWGCNWFMKVYELILSLPMIK